MTIGDYSIRGSVIPFEARVESDLALHHELKSRAFIAVARLPRDATERALEAGLAKARAEGNDADIAELGNTLEAHRRARAALPSLGAERSRRGGK